mmetsp:Transcript_49752/g.113304  ORF Transcript_49752/g.113304 Transcript_49752/m.113304 type:complete len:283 (-) Transcript_49752:82-930(-)
MIGRYTAATAAAAALCLCIAVVQIGDFAGSRAVLGQDGLPSAGNAGGELKGPQYVNLGDRNGFGTNSAFIGMGDGKGTSMRAARAQALSEFSLSDSKIANMQFQRNNQASGVIALPEAGAMGTNAAYMGMDKTLSNKAGFQALRMQKTATTKANRKAMFAHKKAAWAAHHKLALEQRKAHWHKMAMERKAHRAEAKQHGRMAKAAKGMACGRGGPCPQLNQILLKNGVETPKEMAWLNKAGASEKAPFTMLAQQKVNKDARVVGKDIASFLFANKQAHTAGL